MPKTGSASKDIKQISGEFENIVSVASLDTFFYVADANLGYYAIEAITMDNFSEPRPIPGLQGEKEGDFIVPTVMVSFTLGALSNLSLTLGTIAIGTLAALAF